MTTCMIAHSIVPSTRISRDQAPTIGASPSPLTHRRLLIDFRILTYPYMGASIVGWLFRSIQLWTIFLVEIFFPNYSLNLTLRFLLYATSASIFGPILCTLRFLLTEPHLFFINEPVRGPGLKWGVRKWGYNLSKQLVSQFYSIFIGFSRLGIHRALNGLALTFNFDVALGFTSGCQNSNVCT